MVLDPVTGDVLSHEYPGRKGHGILRWSIGPPPRSKPIVIEIYRDTAPMDYDAA